MNHKIKKILIVLAACAAFAAGIFTALFIYSRHTYVDGPGMVNDQSSGSTSDNTINDSSRQNSGGTVISDTSSVPEPTYVPEVKGNSEHRMALDGERNRNREGF